MLLRCLRVELIKFRQSPVWLAFVVLPVFPTILGTMNYLGNLGLLQSEWYSLWSQQPCSPPCSFCRSSWACSAPGSGGWSTRTTTGTVFSPRRCRWGTCALPSYSGRR